MKSYNELGENILPFFFFSYGQSIWYGIMRNYTLWFTNENPKNSRILLA